MKIEFKRLLEWQRLLALFNQVERSVHRKHDDKFVFENDTEHSYNLAMTAWYLAQQFPELDKDLIIRYALVHDLVEAHAGDTYAFGSEDDLASKHQREEEALAKLKKDWPDFADMNEAIQAYEDRADAESRFVYALDKILPAMVTYINEGYSWEYHSVTADMIHESKKDKVGVSPEIAPYYEELHELLLSRPDLIRRS